jgi:DNA (cytosine-5)-methyltransferase 1
MDIVNNVKSSSHRIRNSIATIFGVVVLAGCATNAPHIRQRLYWIAANMADTSNERSQGRLPGRQNAQRQDLERHARCDGAAYGSSDMANCTSERLEGAAGQSLQGHINGSACYSSENVEHSNAVALEEFGVSGERGGLRAGSDAASADHEQRDAIIYGEAVGAGMATSGFWDNAVWLNGADGKTRRAEPNIRLLAHGVPARVGKLRAYGNAIVPPLAAEVIKAFMEKGE